MTAAAIGIDIGTSGARCVGVDEGGRVLAAANAAYPLLTPMPRWTEQDPAWWWQAARTFRDVSEAAIVVRTLPEPDRPDPEAAAIYDGLYAVYTELYRKTAQDMHRLSALATQ